MTAYALQGDRDKCLESGADAYLAKPARPAEILALLEQLVPEPGSAGAEPRAAKAQDTQPVPASPEVQEAVLQVFDAADLVERLGGRDDMVARFVEMFTTVTAGYLKALREAVESGDLEQARIQAHTIKGAAANISAWRMREAADQMETLSREGRREGSTELLKSLEQGFAQFAKESEKYSKQSAA